MQLYPLKLLPNNINFDFIKFKNISYFLSISLSILSIVWIVFFKVNFGIDFAGGISIEARTRDSSVDLSEMRHVLSNLNLGEVVLQNLDNDISIRIGAKKSSEKLMQDIEIIKTELNKKFDLEYRKIDFVGPQVGSQLVTSGFKALILSFIAIMIYIWFRFEWQFGLGVLIALVHDAILALGFMSFTKLDFNLSTVAGILTIIGYSVNDSVVIYDRIRENLRKYRQKSVSNIINISINETLSRTILTVMTTLIANLALILFGGEAIRSFSLLVFCGIIAGTYSSIFISAPILTFFKLEKFK